MVNVAIVQVGSIIHNTKATLEKLKKFTELAAQKQAQLVLFPEAFVGGYPKGLDFGVRLGTRSDEGREEFKRYFDSAIAYDSAESDFIAECARSNYVHLVVGVVERDGGTLYCSVFFYGPNGEKLGRHRKLMPTALERVVWGFGDGSMLPVIDTVVGRIGAVICWENYMPLLRTAMYKKGIQLYLAPTVDDRDTWLSTMRTIAIEGRCYVVSACQYLTSDAYPDDHPARNALHGVQSLSGTQTNDSVANGTAAPRVLIRGGSCAVDPFGAVLTEPRFDGEHVTVVDCELNEIACAKFDLDVVGHYARPDVFQLRVNDKPQRCVQFEGSHCDSATGLTQADGTADADKHQK